MHRGQNCQSSETSITYDRSEYVVNDNSIIHSRSMHRTNLLMSPTRSEITNKLSKTLPHESMCTPLSSEQVVYGEHDFKIPTMMSEFDISQKIEDCVANNNTSRRLNKTILSVTQAR